MYDASCTAVVGFGSVADLEFSRMGFFPASFVVRFGLSTPWLEEN